MLEPLATPDWLRAYHHVECHERYGSDTTVDVDVGIAPASVSRPYEKMPVNRGGAYDIFPLRGDMKVSCGYIE